VRWIGPSPPWVRLHTTVSLCLASNLPLSMAWRPPRLQIYHNGYWPTCGGKPPHSMEQDYKECWCSAWPALGEACAHTAVGATSCIENRRMFLGRNGYLEETSCTFFANYIIRRGEHTPQSLGSQ